MGIIIGVFGIIMSTGNIFLYCFVGSLTTSIFWGNADIAYESLWYKLPIDLQKYLLLLLVDAQRPIIFHGFGIINLDLIFFMKVKI